MKKKTVPLILLACLFMFSSIVGGAANSKSGQGAQFPDYTERAIYIPMRDGVKLAINICLPEGLPAGERIPALLIQTRYWRGYQFRDGLGDPKLLDPERNFKLFFASHGYALIYVDVRGTGASFGASRYPWTPEEIQDGSSIVDWIVAQPWSNDKVGAIGISYLGSTAQFLAVPNNPAVKAVIPQFMEYDVYTDIAFPGGVFNDEFVKGWDRENHLLDNNIICDDDSQDCKLARLYIKGVKPVDIDKNRNLLDRAIKEHRKNGEIYLGSKNLTFRDQRSPLLGTTVDGFSVHSYAKQIERSNVAIFGWGSWMDAATANAVINRMLTLSNSQKAIIGPWNHGAYQDASPYNPPNAPVEPSLPEQWALAMRFFDYYLKGIDNGVTADPRLTYYTLGEEKWKTTDVWPPAGATTKRWYLGAGGQLSLTPPSSSSGEDRYTVNFEATTGPLNRWATQLSAPDVIYPDRAAQDSLLLAYTSAPLEKDTEITGHPVVTLQVSSTHPDGAFYVYLEDVDENGKVIYVTEGQLRAFHRKVSTEKAPYNNPAPYHSFKKADASLMVPGAITELKFGLNPTSVLIKKGHRIRIAIAGHDASFFARIPAEGTPVIDVFRNSLRASFIDLPVIPRD